MEEDTGAPGNTPGLPGEKKEVGDFGEAGDVGDVLRCLFALPGPTPLPPLFPWKLVFTEILEPGFESLLCLRLVGIAVASESDFWLELEAFDGEEKAVGTLFVEGPPDPVEAVELADDLRELTPVLFTSKASGLMC